MDESHRARGQALLIELTASLFVFLLVFLFLQNLWPQNFSRWQEEQEHEVMYRRATQLAAALAESPGYPADWSTESVEAIGLAKLRNVLDENKVDMFAVLAASDYNAAKRYLRFFEYEFFVQIDANSPALDRNIGRVPPLGQNTVTVSRIVVMGGENALLRLSVFR
jgi:hypothetical protein